MRRSSWAAPSPASTASASSSEPVCVGNSTPAPSPCNPQCAEPWTRSRYSTPARGNRKQAAYLAPGGLPGAGGRPVAAQDLGPVPVPRRGRPVGVADQRPAPPVNHHVMVEEADQDAIIETSFAAVALVLEVMHLARRRGLIAAAGPLTPLVPGLDRVPDPGRDIIGIPDVQ